jgi:signal peptidase I
MSRVAREIVEAIALALIVFIVIQGSVRNFKVDGSSMHPTLDGGQYLLVNKLVYFQVDTQRLSRIIPFWKVDRPSEHFAIHPPKRGEVIVFRFPRDPSKDFVKRVIGLPGESVELRQGTVYINGAALEEPYLTAPGNSTRPPILLGEKQYYVLGDNRASSNDSRVWGPVPEENVVGKVWLVYWPFAELRLLNSAALFLQGTLW